MFIEVSNRVGRILNPKWHLYVVRAADGTLYTGIATNVERRMAEHRAGGARGSKYLRGRGPIRLVFSRSIGDRALALRLERHVKRLPKQQKEALIRKRGRFPFPGFGDT